MVAFRWMTTTPGSSSSVPAASKRVLAEGVARDAFDECSLLRR
jgi:hypothetical protein